MARAVGTAFRDGGFADGTIVARNPKAGRELAERLGYSWRTDVPATGAVIVNATPVGMAGGEDQDTVAFDTAAIEGADVVFDVVAMPAETPLIGAAREADKRVITGAEVIALQAAEQFERYTGVRPTREQIEEAAQHSRST
jgi:shikimate dehydrogenase